MEFCPPLLEELSTSSWVAPDFLSARQGVGRCRRPSPLAMSIDHAKSNHVLLSSVLLYSPSVEWLCLLSCSYFDSSMVFHLFAIDRSWGHKGGDSAVYSDYIFKLCHTWVCGWMTWRHKGLKLAYTHIWPLDHVLPFQPESKRNAWEVHLAIHVVVPVVK